MSRLTLVSMTLIMAGSAELAAQATPDQSLESRCITAATASRTATDRDERKSAVEFIKACSQDLRVNTYVALLRENRRADKDEAMAAAFPLTTIRDARLFGEVIALAGDKGASTAGRVVAFMTLSVVKNPKNSPRYEGFSGGLNEKGHPLIGCHWIVSHVAASSSGPVPLPGDYLAQIAAVRDRVYNDASEPQEVRSAAACL